MKKAKKSVYLRYEFSDEKGKLEGGDIFELASVREAQNMATEIFKVALADGVAVNVTIGVEAPFMGFLKNVGLNVKHIQAEMVTDDSAPIAAKPAKGAKAKPAKKAKKKAAPRAKAKKK